MGERENVCHSNMYVYYCVSGSRQARQAAARPGLSEERPGCRDRSPAKRGPGTRVLLDLRP
jgi:hypothetical protein